jgi:hypothetical protein
MEEVNSAITRAKHADEECKRVLEGEPVDLYNELYRDLYFNEMLEGLHKIGSFSRLQQKAFYYLESNNILLATKQVAKLNKRLLEEQEFLNELGICDSIKAQIEEVKNVMAKNIEESIIQYLFLTDQSSLQTRVSKLYSLYYKDFEAATQENERSIPNDFAFMIHSVLLDQYFTYVIDEYTTNRADQVTATLELIGKYEKERKTNLVISGGVEKLMTNTSTHVSSQNVSRLVLLLYCYSNIGVSKQLNEVMFEYIV